MYRNTHAPGRKCPASKSDATTRRADYALANQPFNDSDWFLKEDDVRLQPSGARQIAKGNPQGERGGVHQFGFPPKPAQRDSVNLLPEGKPQVVSEARDNNANFAWVQHFIHHLAPQTALRDSAFLRSKALPQVVCEAKDNMAGFALANGSMSSNQSGECVARSASSKPEAKLHGLGRQRDIRRALIEADLVDCMVALPGQLFYSTQIPVCLWFLSKNKAADAKRGFRDRQERTRSIGSGKLAGVIHNSQRPNELN
jgi:type I restriction enzyme M protein